MLERKREYAGSIKKDESQYDDSLYYYVSKVAIKCSLEPLSIEVLKVIQLEEEINIKEKASSNFIEDNFYKVEVVDGKINITDKISNRELKDCLYIEESGDDGDTYDYSPPEEQYDFRYNLDFKNAKVDINNGKLYKEIKISGEFKVPMNLKYREENIRNTEIPYELILTLSNKEIVECNLEIDNKACDHRMRAVLRTDINSKESISDTSFGTIRRDNVPAHINDWRELGWKEEPSPIYPMLHFVGIEEENKSVFMLAKGIKEYEVLENSNIALTLFRGVGFLGKPDLIRRPGIASGNEFRYIETPDSQLKEKLKFKFAITINNEVNITKINKIWKNYSITIPNYQIQEINRFTNTLKYFVMHPLKDKLEEVKDIVDCNDLNDIVVTSIIPVDKNSFTVRFVNYTDKVIDGGNIKVSKGKSYEWVNMNNKEISNKENIDSSINIGKFKSGEIKTLKINI